MIEDRCGTENRTALISLGIPKLVRFAKIRPNRPMVLLYLIIFGSLQNVTRSNETRDILK
jgi:hypothetical protein